MDNIQVGSVGRSGGVNSLIEDFYGPHLHYEILDGTSLDSPRLDPSAQNRKLLPIEKEWGLL